MAPRVLFIDSEQRLQRLLNGYLSQRGFATIPAVNLPSALAVLQREPPDAVLVSSVLSDADGLDAIRSIRTQSQVPIILIRTEEDTRDILPALQLGANDYLRSPFDPEDLLLRLRTLLARRPGPVVLGDIEADPAARRLRLKGEEVPVTAIEFDLLLALLRHPGEVLSRELLLQEAGRGDVVVGERTVDVHISHLRRKLGEAPGKGRRIRAVRGVGYVLTVDIPDGQR